MVSLCGRPGLLHGRVTNAYFHLFFLPVFPSDFLWWEVDKEVSQGGLCLVRKERSRQDHLVPAVSLPQPWGYLLSGEADPSRKEGHSEIDPLSGLSPLVSLFSWYFAEWLLGQGAGFEFWNQMGF